MFADCYPLVALLQTSLTGFFDHDYIDSSNTFQALNYTTELNTSRFSLDTTIAMLVNQLMVEEYTHSISYEDYYNECGPSSCSYSYENKANAVTNITTIVALFDGLVIVCRVVVVLMMKIYRSPSRRVSPLI